jgi:predicted PurR-regulated permease PerM
VKKATAIISIILLVAFVLAGCGGNSPKALAKQTADLTKQIIDAQSKGEDTSKLEKKFEELEKKVDNLSGDDLEAYEKEVSSQLESILGDLGNALKGLDLGF